MTRLKNELSYAPDGHINYKWERLWNIQPKPYRTPLQFSYEKAYISGSVTNNYSTDILYYGIESIGFGVPGRETGVNDAVNKCYGKLVGKLGDASQWANNLLEANQAVEGAAARILQVARFAGKLRKGDVVGAARALGTPVPKRLRGNLAKAKSFGDQFLEFHFGWVPLAQDIHSAMETISKPDFGKRKVFASGTSHDHWIDRSRDEAGGGLQLSTWTRKAAWKCKAGAVVRVNNPNAYLASQLGLVNPFSIAWEAVPFSFVVDWFGNVGQILAASTDFVGLEVTLPYTTISTDLITSYETYNDDGRNHISQGGYKGVKFNVSRGYGIPVPVLRVKPFRGLSFTRGVTAISLLLQKIR